LCFKKKKKRTPDLPGEAEKTEFSKERREPRKETIEQGEVRAKKSTSEGKGGSQQLLK